jgi:hypothetical protein
VACVFYVIFVCIPYDSVFFNKVAKLETMPGIPAGLRQA